MLSKEDNALITRVGPGAPMGNLMRQYRIPALRSTELPGPDCAPIRLKLPGEQLVAFRDAAGRVGVVANASRIAVPRCSSAATMSTAFAACTTAGRSTLWAPASTRRTSRWRAISRPRCMPPRIPCRREFLTHHR